MTQEKTKVVYTIVDDVEVEIHMFSATVSELAKDVVASFLTTQVLPNTYHNGLENEGAKDLLTAISNSDSIESLIAAMAPYDLRLAVLAV